MKTSSSDPLEDFLPPPLVPPPLLDPLFLWEEPNPVLELNSDPGVPSPEPEP